ncbi:MAG: manganese efflux pump [Firmicutes bacterium]|nr:manganese efflux pump [Bacillota bacterium]
MIIAKMVALVLSLGMDTLMMSISLGFLQTRGKVKIALTFAGAEALMPVVGLIVGQTVGRVIGDWAALVGGLALVAVAAWLSFFEDEDDDEKQFERDLAGWPLILTALSISLDELAVGFSIGIIEVPVALTIALIALQAFLFTLVGLTFGSTLTRDFGGTAKKFAGLVLGMLGLWITIKAIVHLLYP